MTHKAIVLLLLTLIVTTVGCAAAESVQPSKTKFQSAQSTQSAEIFFSAGKETGKAENVVTNKPSETTDFTDVFASIPSKKPAEPEKTPNSRNETTTNSTKVPKPESGKSKPVTEKPAETEKPVTTSDKPKTTETQKSQSPPPAHDTELPKTSPPATTQPPKPHTHSWSEWKIVQASCTEDGIKYRTCPGCGEVQSQPIPAKGHNFGAWMVLSEPTTERTGLQQRTCSVCGVHELRSMDRLPAPGSPIIDTEWMAQRFLELLNEERAKTGAQPLVTDNRLHEMARVRAAELTVFFDHDRPNGESSRTIYTEFEYGNRYDYSSLGAGIIYYPTHYGEDIGQTGVSEGSTASEEAVRKMMDGFRGSIGHWSDLTNPVYGAAGVAVSFERIDMGDDFPAMYRCSFEVLLTDRLYE